MDEALPFLRESLVDMFFLAAVFVLAFPFRSPAPLVYRPGEGWTYELPGNEEAG